jgi:hypothetical protein
MTLFNEDDLANVPILVNWTIVQGDRGPPLLTGMHTFHEGNRVVAVEVSLVDPLLRWVIGADGKYSLSGSAIEFADLIRNDLVRWREIVRSSGVTAE